MSKAGHETSKARRCWGQNRCFGQFGLTPWLILHTYYIEERPSLEPRGMRCRAVLRGV